MIVNDEVDFHDKMSPDCQDFIEKCLTKDQIDRPLCAQMLQHDWISAENSPIVSNERQVKTID